MLDLVADAVRDALEHVGREAEPVCRHRVFRGNRTHTAHFFVGSLIALHAYATHGQQAHQRLPDVVVEARAMDLVDIDGVRFAQRIEPLFRNRADTPHTEAGAGEGVPQYNLVRQAEFTAHTMHPTTDHEAVAHWEQRKSELRETIEHLEHDLEEVKTQRQATPHHLEWDELEAEDKFERLAPSRKRLLDTVKLIAYRSETALTTIVRSTLSREDDARSLVRDLFRSAADITPDLRANELRIGVHSLANPRSNRAIGALLEELNASELTYPGTCLKLVYTLLGASAN